MYLRRVISSKKTSLYSTHGGKDTQKELYRYSKKNVKYS